ncbi:hypothetical protein TIFTF001_051491 [Ficus carica]|uniref:Uncharacterized protein n=1 Tax=Ficus carica TaxID=3494 RepID=A0AA87Z5Q7_FICCA|nr:hypothetical protein TIFTF001_051491 [Ficus carica]
MSRKLVLKSCKFEGIEVRQQSIPSHDELLFTPASSLVLQADEHPPTIRPSTSELITASVPHPTAVNLLS